MLQGTLFHNIEVRGEIQSLSTKNRYTYISLIDADSSGDSLLNVVVGPYCDILAEKYEVGDVIILRGNLNYYKARGSVSFWPTVLRNDGEGQELLRLEKLKQKLFALGIFDSARKKELPRYVNNLAVVTSSSGAVINDIKSTLKSRFPVHLKVYSANVQGSDAARTLINALNSAIADHPDLIILARGGGSKADLAPFNDEKLVMTMASCNIPIISAVGHQVDTSLTDLAADKSAITPTEAATMVGLSLNEVDSNRKHYQERINWLLTNSLSNLYLKHIELKRQLEARSPQNLIKLKERDYNIFKNSLSQMINEKINNLLNELYRKKEIISSLNPLNVLTKGYAYIYKDKQKITSSKETNRDDILKVYLSDGELEVWVKEKKEYE